MPTTRSSSWSHPCPREDIPRFETSLLYNVYSNRLERSSRPPTCAKALSADGQARDEIQEGSVEPCLPWPLLSCLASLSPLSRTPSPHECQRRLRPTWCPSYSTCPGVITPQGYAGWDTIEVAQALEVIQESDGREGEIPHNAGTNRCGSADASEFQEGFGLLRGHRCGSIGESVFQHASPFQGGGEEEGHHQ